MGVGATMKSTAQRKRERRHERLERAWGPPGYVGWVKRRPCDSCGLESIVGRLNEMHHEPPGSRKTWLRSCTLCTSCHVSGPNARHGLNSGVETFWTRVGKDPAEVTAAVQREWAEHAGF